MYNKKSGESFERFLCIAPREYEKYSLVTIPKNHLKIFSHIFHSTLRIGSC